MNEARKEKLLLALQRVAAPFIDSAFFQDNFTHVQQVIPDVWGGGVMMSILHEGDPVLIIQGGKWYHDPPSISDESFEEISPVLDQMCSEGQPIEIDSGTVYCRVMWVLADAEQNRRDGLAQREGCALPPHRLLEPCPYESQYAIEVQIPEIGYEIFTFTFSEHCPPQGYIQVAHQQ